MVREILKNVCKTGHQASLPTLVLNMICMSELLILPYLLFLQSIVILHWFLLPCLVILCQLLFFFEPYRCWCYLGIELSVFSFYYSVPPRTSKLLIYLCLSSQSIYFQILLWNPSRSLISLSSQNTSLLISPIWKLSLFYIWKTWVSESLSDLLKILKIECGWVSF